MNTCNHSWVFLSKGIMRSILKYLDTELKTYYKQNEKYPKQILLSKAIYDTIFKELKNDINN